METETIQSSIRLERPGMEVSMESLASDSPLKVAMIGTHPPRRCGIATFTNDLAAAMEEQPSEVGNVAVIALDDCLHSHRYPARVKLSIRQEVAADYEVAVDFIRAASPDVLLVQHEYGIFGGVSGALILKLMQSAPIPIVTTLHTVLDQPTLSERQIMNAICRLSDRVVVMCHTAEAILRDQYSIPAKRIAVIPHGIPDRPRVSSDPFKHRLGAQGRPVILTFGLLSPGKGIEHMIEAMPTIVASHADVLYVVLGETHPNIVREQGESYRKSLQARAAQLGVNRNVSFINRFVELEELCDSIQAADVYVTPYLGEAQISSGTLAYALGLGKPVVSTPYRYAEEMLSEGGGVLVPAADPLALAAAVHRLLANDTERINTGAHAYASTRHMVWAEVARRYLSLCRSVMREEHLSKPDSSPTRVRTDKAVRRSLAEPPGTVTALGALS